MPRLRVKPLDREKLNDVARSLPKTHRPFMLPLENGRGTYNEASESKRTGISERIRERLAGSRTVSAIA